MFYILADQTTSILDPNMDIGGLLGLVVKILSYGLGAAAVIGVVVAGIMYLTARDNESQVTAAKQRLLNTVIGLVAWVVMFSVVSWLIPGSMPDPENPPNTSECQAHPKRKDCFETYTSQEQMLNEANRVFAANERDMSTVLTNLYTVYVEKGYSFANVPQGHIEAMSCQTIDTLHYKAHSNGDSDGLKVIEDAGVSKGCEWG